MKRNYKNSDVKPVQEDFDDSTILGPAHKGESRRRFIQKCGRIGVSAALSHFMLLGGPLRSDKIAFAACTTDDCAVSYGPPIAEVGDTCAENNWDACYSNGISIELEGDECPSDWISAPHGGDSCLVNTIGSGIEDGDECKEGSLDYCTFNISTNKYFGDECHPSIGDADRP